MVEYLLYAVVIVIVVGLGSLFIFWVSDRITEYKEKKEWEKAIEALRKTNYKRKPARAQRSK